MVGEILGLEPEEEGYSTFEVLSFGGRKDGLGCQSTDLQPSPGLPHLSSTKTVAEERFCSQK